jgi:ribulose-phosphate 3-epimerase
MRPRPEAWIDALPRDRLIGEFSLWSADLVRLADELARIRPHADILHVDVADGRFSPGLLFFPDLVAAIRGASPLPIHAHLMVADDILLAQVAQFAEAGCALVSIHAENAAAGAALDLLERRGIAAGMVVGIGTPVAASAPFLTRLSFLTLLGTATGVKGQGLDPRAPARLGEARALIAARGAGRRIVLAADGAIREETAPVLRAAGAEAVVLGSLAFRAPDLARRMSWLHRL